MTTPRLRGAGTENHVMIPCCMITPILSKNKDGFYRGQLCGSWPTLLLSVVKSGEITTLGLEER